MGVGGPAPGGQRDLRVDRHTIGQEKELALAATRRAVRRYSDRPAVAGRVAVLKEGLRQAHRRLDPYRGGGGGGEHQGVDRAARQRYRGSASRARRTAPRSSRRRRWQRRPHARRARCRTSRRQAGRSSRSGGRRPADRRPGRRSCSPPTPVSGVERPQTAATVIVRERKPATRIAMSCLLNDDKASDATLPLQHRTRLS
jgi:hypothetical protein